MSAPPVIFDARLRAIRSDRAARAGRADFVARHIADELVERLALITRTFDTALAIGPPDETLAAAAAARGASVMHTDLQDILPFAPGSFHLIVSAGGLDRIDDLPGLLVQIRRLLRPDGLFLAGFVGAGSLATMRRALAEAEAIGGRGASPRIHPQIDVRTAGDLMQRTGFALPVVDGETLEVRYASLAGAVADIRAAGAQNLLLARDRTPFTRAEAAAAHAAFAARAGANGKVAETLALVYLLGWAPSESQPRPARRGSGTASLAAILEKPGSERDA